MAKLTNTPVQNLNLDLETNKPYTFRVDVMHADRTPVNLTGFELFFVMKEGYEEDDSYDTKNLIVNYEATITNAAQGQAVFAFQAAELDSPPGEYPYTAVVRDADGYTSVLFKGVVNMLENMEADSVHHMFNVTKPHDVVTAVIRSGDIVEVQANTMISGPPGPMGSPGLPGPQGIPGQAGERGPTGPTGARGDPGSTGQTGPKGDAGPKGEKGNTGPAGAPGATGSTGPDGAQGPQGPKGDKGDIGARGPAGPDGAQGPQGPVGLPGPKGDTGLQGPQGPAGQTGATGSKGDTGATGERGPEGPSGPQGGTGPTGPKGDKGDKGDTGDTGPAGPAGPTATVLFVNSLSEVPAGTPADTLIVVRGA